MVSKQLLGTDERANHNAYKKKDTRFAVVLTIKQTDYNAFPNQLVEIMCKDVLLQAKLGLLYNNSFELIGIPNLVKDKVKP